MSSMKSCWRTPAPALGRVAAVLELLVCQEAVRDAWALEAGFMVRLFLAVSRSRGWDHRRVLQAGAEKRAPILLAIQ